MKKDPRYIKGAGQTAILGEIHTLAINIRIQVAELFAADTVLDSGNICCALIDNG
jgi:hypothetical protein